MWNPRYKYSGSRVKLSDVTGSSTRGTPHVNGAISAQTSASSGTGPLSTFLIAETEQIRLSYQSLEWYLLVGEFALEIYPHFPANILRST